jgi:hypothetical protein
VGPLGGTWYGTYAANWAYRTHMPILDIWTWPRRDVPGLGLTNEDIYLLRVVGCDILAHGFNIIDRILIPPWHTFFFRSPTVKKSSVKRG